MSYAIKEIYYTLQGEGVNAGRPAVFCRFAGCNLWSGREHDRPTAVCQFCDTDFVGTDGPGGGTFNSAKAVADTVLATWHAPVPARTQSRFVVCTGGEPLLQLDRALVAALHAVGFTVAVETNGTQPLPEGVDWVCLSPKAGAEPVIRSGDELKLVYPQTGAPPEQYEEFDFDFFYLQPMDGPSVAANTERAVRYCLDHPHWRLGVQQHKVLGLR